MMRWDCPGLQKRETTCAVIVCELSGLVTVATTTFPPTAHSSSDRPVQPPTNRAGRQSGSLVHVFAVMDDHQPDLGFGGRPKTHEIRADLKVEGVAHLDIGALADIGR